MIINITVVIVILIVIVIVIIMIITLINVRSDSIRKSTVRPEKGVHK